MRALSREKNLFDPLRHGSTRRHKSCEDKILTGVESRTVEEGKIVRQAIMLTGVPILTSNLLTSDFGSESDSDTGVARLKAGSLVL